MDRTSRDRGARALRRREKGDARAPCGSPSSWRAPGPAPFALQSPTRPPYNSSSKSAHSPARPPHLQLTLSLSLHRWLVPAPPPPQRALVISSRAAFEHPPPPLLAQCSLRSRTACCTSHLLTLPGQRVHRCPRPFLPRGPPPNGREGPECGVLPACVHHGQRVLARPSWEGEQPRNRALRSLAGRILMTCPPFLGPPSAPLPV